MPKATHALPVDAANRTEIVHADPRIAALHPREALGQVEALESILPDVTAILAAATTGDMATVSARAELLRDFVTNRTLAIIAAHVSPGSHRRRHQTTTPKEGAAA